MIWQLSSLPALPQAAGGGGEVTITAEITDTGDRPAGEFTLEGPNEGAFGADTTVFTVVWDRPQGVSIDDAPLVEVDVQIVPAAGSNLDQPEDLPQTAKVDIHVQEWEIRWQTSKEEQGQEVFTNGTIFILLALEPRIVSVAQSQLPLGRARTSFGVGEIVILTVIPSEQGAVQWAVNPPSSGIFLDESNSNPVRYQAPVSAAEETVVATLPDSTMLEINLDTITPVVKFHEKAAGAASFVNDGGHFTFTGWAPVELTPNTVNFDAVDGFESGVNAALAGYFEEDPDFYDPHLPNGPHMFRFLRNPYGNFIYNSGAAAQGFDLITHSTHGRPYHQGGTFNWPIEWTYLIGVGAQLPMGPSHQKSEITLQGAGPAMSATYRVEKGDIQMGEATKENPNAE